MGRKDVLVAPVAMRLILGLFVLISSPVFAGPQPPSLSKRMEEEIDRRRRELDQLEQRWMDVMTECVCRPDPAAIVHTVHDLAAKAGARQVVMVERDDGPLRGTPGRRSFSIQLEASRPQLRGLLDELAHLKVPTNVRDLHLRDTGAARLTVSFRLNVYDDGARAIEAAIAAVLKT